MVIYDESGFSSGAGITSSPIRIFVGCDCNNSDLESQCVLEHSLRKHASQTVEIVWMQLSRDPLSPFYSEANQGWRTERWQTPFSGFRWAVPELCGFEGKAIYCDSDIIFLADIAELWSQEFEGGKVVMAKGGASWRFCVSLFDCVVSAAVMKPLFYLRSRPQAHQEMIAKFKGADFVQAFKGQWNYCDNEDHGPLSEAKAVHYTEIPSQPQLKYAIPRLKAEGKKHWFDGKPIDHPRREIAELFDREFAEARAAGYTPERYRVESFGEYKKRSLRGYTPHAA